MAIGYPDAVYGGIIAIYTPCAGVIVPAFLAHLAGSSALAGPRQGRWVNGPLLLGSVAFALGFSLVFVLLGTLGAASEWVRGHQEAVTKGGGIVVMLFGLLATGIVPLPALERAPRARLGVAAARYLASGVVGLAFAIGWTPCVNQQLGNILTLSHDPSTAGEGARLLTVYSLAFMSPFVAVGAAIAVAVPWLPGGGAPHSLPPLVTSPIPRPAQGEGSLQPRALLRRGVGVVAGLALMALGALVFSGRFVELTGYLYRLG